MRSRLALALAVLLAAGCAGPVAPPTAPTQGTPPPGADQGAPPPAPPGSEQVPACVERAAGMPFQQVVDAAGGQLAPGALASGPLARVLTPEALQAVDACLLVIAAPGGVAGAPPGAPGAPGALPGAPPGAPVGSDLPACVERAAGMPFQQVQSAAGTSFMPGQLAQSGLAQVLAPDKIAAVEACFSTVSPPSGPPPGGDPMAALGGPLRQLSAQEKAELQATADRVRASAVVVGQLQGGRFAPGGSGFVYSADGLVMTNAHVVESISGAPRVMLADGRVVAATVVGRITSLQPDVGVLRISASGLSPAVIGDSNAVRRGDPLIAIGHPRGFGYWLATGGQAYGQRETAPPGTMDLYAELSSNVPNAPGGSGAPVFNAAGEVVGLLFAGQGEGEPGAVKPVAPSVVRDPDQWSSIANRLRTTAVAINDAVAAAREIVARGDLPAWSRPGNIPPEASGLLPDFVVEPLPTAAPLPSDASILGALDPTLRTVVHLQTWKRGERYATATGFVISADGYILTNAHNLDDGVDAFDITFHDGRTAKARLVGIDRDQQPDVGVLKVDLRGLQPAAVGSAAALRSGEELFLIGNPALRGEWRISAGPFDSLDTSTGHTQVLASLPFAAGNSGGPLVNARGEVVGLFHGTLPMTPAPIRASDPTIVWGWYEFDQLFNADAPRSRLAAAAAIDVAMSRAQQIIKRQGSVP